MRVKYNADLWVDVQLYYNYVGDNVWSASPGYLRASEGTWTIGSGWLGGDVSLWLNDQEGESVAWGRGFLLRDWFGYPFNQDFLKLSSEMSVVPGGYMPTSCWWSFLQV
jgi:hypothetical protein